MQNFSQFGPVVLSGEGLGMKKGHSIFYYESTCKCEHKCGFFCDSRSSYNSRHFLLSITIEIELI